MDRSVKRRRIGVIIVWLVWAFLMALLFYGTENRLVREETRDELLDQANTIAGQLPVMAENHFCAELGNARSQYAKLKALAMVLDGNQDPESIQELLDDFVEITGAEGLMVYDRQGNVLYRSGETDQIGIQPEKVGEYLDRREYDSIDKTLARSEEYWDYLFSSDIIDDGLGETFAWSAHEDQWLLALREVPSEAEREIIDYFNWRNVLRGITIGEEGCLLAVDSTDGTVLSWKEKNQENRSVGELGIRIGGDSRAAGVTELQDAFSGEDPMREIRISGTDYAAVRVNVDRMLTLALLPMEEINAKLFSAVTLRVQLLLLVSGICTGYAFFHMRDGDKTAWKKKKRFHWDRTLTGKLKVVAIAAMAIVLLCGSYLEAMSVYAETFSYSRERVNRVVDLLEKNTEAVEKLQQWCDDENLTRGIVARYILEHTEKEEITRDYLQKLSDSLGIRSVSVFDTRGRITASNSLRKETAIADSSPFRALLEGRETLVGNPEKDDINGGTFQIIGVTLWNQDHTNAGMILIETTSEEMETIRNNLGFGTIFEQISLTDGTCFLVIDDHKLTIEYIGEVKGGSFQTGLNDYDYTGLRASEIGIDESLLLDHFNGEMFVLKNRYFASARRVEGHYFLVMRQQYPIGWRQMAPVLLAAGGLLIFMLVLLLDACAGRRAETGGNGKETKPPAEEKPKSAETEKPKRRGDDAIAMLRSLVTKEKPYFEQRWPEDSIRWRNRTPEDQFAIFLKIATILTVTVIFVHALLSRENSLWYYCVSGEWNSGINLYSITSCFITFVILLVVKMVLHKLLYWIARAVNAKGETICHLLDSFSGYTLAIAGIFLCLSSIGVDTTTLSLTGGVLGVVFGIGCQNIVADILAGILMTFEGVVHVGDFVSYNGQYGVVLSIGVRTTQLKWFGEITIVRNNEFKNYINMPANNEDRVTVNLTVDVTESLERVERILEEELPQIHERLDKTCGDRVGGPNYLGVTKISENGVTLVFDIYCKGMYYAWISRMLNRELKTMCERRGIRIAMNQVMLHEAEHIENRPDSGYNGEQNGSRQE